MSKTFRAWDVDQVWLFPPSVQDFVPARHMAHFVRETVRGELDLGAIMASYVEERGYPPYHPAMMVALLLYGYSRGVYSSRQLERACEERVDFMAVTGMSRPDFRTIAEFRRRHLKALGDFANKQQRLERLRRAKATLEAEAKAPPADDDGPGPSTGMMDHGKPRRAPDGGPPEQAQRNFTDPTAASSRPGTA